MTSLVDFLLFTVAWSVGIGIGILCILQSLTILRFAIPTIVRLNNERIMVNYVPLRNSVISLILFCTVLILFSLFVGYFFPYYTWPYIIGLACCVIFSGTRTTSTNKDNVINFVENNKEYIQLEEIEPEQYDYLFNPKAKEIAVMKQNEVFARVFGESIHSILFYGICVLVISFLGNFSWWFGVILFGLFTLLGIATLIQIIFSSVGAVALFFAHLYRAAVGTKNELTDQLFSIGSTVIQTIEISFSIYYFLYLYNVFF